MIDDGFILSNTAFFIAVLNATFDPDSAPLTAIVRWCAELYVCSLQKTKISTQSNRAIP